MRIRLTLPLAITVLITACTPPPSVTQAVGGLASTVVNTISNPKVLAALGQLVPPPRLANKLLSPIFMKTGSGAPPTLEEVKRFLSITNGALIGKLPREGNQTSFTVRTTQGIGGFGILAVGTQEVGTGGVSPYQAAQIAIQNPLQLEDAPIFAAGLAGTNFRIQSLPPTVDLRTNAQMPAIRSQGRRGTCVLHSTAAIVDFLYATDPVDTIRHASVEFMDWLYHIEVKANSTRLKNTLWTDNGTYPHLLHLALRVDGNRETSDDDPYVPPQQGYLSEDQCPYNPSLANGSVAADFRAEAERRLGATLAGQIAQGQTFKSQGAYFFPVKLDLPSLKAALAGGSPIQVTYPVYRPDWYNVDATNPYVGELDDTKTADTSNLGYHSVCIVGYKDDASAAGGGWFIVRNSWGTNWGEGGYCYVSYATTLNYASDTCIAQPYTAQFNAVYSVTPPSKDAPPTPAPTAAPSASPTSNPNQNQGQNQTIINTSEVQKNGSYTTDDETNGTGIDSLSLPNLLKDFLSLFF